MLDKKQIRAVFLFEFKMGCKAAEAICNINSHLAQELLMNIQCSGGSRSFAKETGVLKMRSTVASHRKLTTTYWEDHRSWSTCRRTNINTSKVTHHVKQIGKVKKIHKGEPHVVVVQSAQSCPTLCDPMDCSTPGIPVPHHLPQFAQTHVCWTDDAIQPSHPLSPTSPPALNLFQHQRLFQWVSSLHQVTKVLELQHQSLQWIFRVDFPSGLTGLISLQSKGLSRVFSSIIQKHQFLSTQPSL